MILETIAEATRKRVAAEKEKCSLAEMKEKATAMNPDTGFPFEQTLKKPGMSFICEVKKASPSKGIQHRRRNPRQRESVHRKIPLPELPFDTGRVV